jgi:hypothetical protein
MIRETCLLPRLAQKSPFRFPPNFGRSFTALLGT